VVSKKGVNEDALGVGGNTAAAAAASSANEANHDGQMGVNKLLAAVEPTIS